MNKIFFLIFFVIQSFVSLSQSITNISVSQRQDGSGKVDVNYTLSGDEDAYDITAEVSLNNGATWQAIYNLSGNVNNVLPGTRQLVWNAGAEMPGVYVSNARIKLTATESGGGTGQPCPGIPTVTYAGQTYNTVYIGAQCWLKENLNVGTKINSTTSGYQQTNNGIIEKYCYNNNIANCAIYGGLYEWPEAMQYVTTEGVQGICPAGWHIPTDAEWTTLTTFLGGESVAGGKMKEAGFAHWNSPNTGATNESGFTGLPGGYRTHDSGVFGDLGFYGGFWSSSQGGTSNAYYRYLLYNRAYMHRSYASKARGFSIRCLKNL
jgi:uncharacterized protein (TIGR02145 family)